MKAVSFVVCEHIRREDSGKLILLGVFTSNRILNNTPVESRWGHGFQFAFLVGLNLNRQTDVGPHSIQLRLLSTGEAFSVMRLDVKAEGNDHFIFPVAAGIPFAGPDTVVVEAVRMNGNADSIELGRFEFVDG